MSFPRNNNPLYKTITRRSNSPMIDGNSSNENIIPQIFNEMQELSKQVISLQNSHNELIKILSPMFPRDTSEHTNMKDTRYINKVMQEARSDKKETPSNLARILALLRYLYSLNPTHTNVMSTVEETITDQYDMLKANARRLRQKLYFDNPEMKGSS